MAIMDVRDIKTPQDTKCIRRYMGFTKFASMLVTHSLHFSRIDQFDDRLEGTLPKAKQQERGASVTEMYEKVVKPISYVSCWELSPIESVLMWKAYSHGEPLVAIESSVGTVRKIFDTVPNAYVLGEVQYIDYEESTFEETGTGTNIIIQAYHKREYFRDENEFRIMLSPLSTLAESASKEEKTGLYIKVPLECLIHRVRLPSDASHWFSETVGGVCEQFGIDKEIVRSDI